MSKHWTCDLCNLPITGTPKTVKFKDLGYDCCVVRYKERYHGQCWSNIREAAMNIRTERLTALQKEIGE